MFLFIIHFWWWEYRLQSLAVISFGVYLFLISFCCLFFFLCVLIFPTTLEDYGGYEEYFISRRRWFFGMLAVTYVVDFCDTLLKGKAYLAGLAGSIRHAMPYTSCSASPPPGPPTGVFMRRSWLPG